MSESITTSATCAEVYSGKDGYPVRPLGDGWVLMHTLVDRAGQHHWLWWRDGGTKVPTEAEQWQTRAREWQKRAEAAEDRIYGHAEQARRAMTELRNVVAAGIDHEAVKAAAAVLRDLEKQR